MNKKRIHLLGLAILSLVVIWILAGRFLAVQAEDGSPAASVERAWRNAQDAGSYRFISDIDQTLVPRAIPEMVGQQDTALNLALDGAVVLPDQSYVELQLAGANRSESVALLREGGQSFMLKNGELKPVEDVLNLTSQTNDVLGYLAAAEEVTLVEPPPGHPELLRYSFTISGPRFAEYVREQAEATLRAEPGAPAGLSLKPLSALQSLRGTGELWVNQRGLPVRQVLDLELPEVNKQYGARIHMLVNLFAFGQVDALPRAVQEGNGTWRLEGSPPSTPARDVIGAASMRENPPAEMATTTLPAWLSRLAGQIPSPIATSGLTLFILALLASVAIRYYRRHTRLCYILIVVIVVPILLLSTLLRSEHAGRFQERRAQAAEARAAAVPELLAALDLETATTETAQGMVAAAEGSGALQRCGDGEPGVDTDGDGLLDTVELCLGTDPENTDSDYDAISDREELEGFDFGGKHWDSDPLRADSNRDGIADTYEWPSDLSQYGAAVAIDLDSDGIPNLWDDDDDGDLVPDWQDLSPFAVTGYMDELVLSTTGQVASGGIQTIEVVVQPEDMSHLRYSTTALDWPADELGNVQDLDNSTADLRLTPFLLVTTNVAPDETLAAKYGLRSWVDDQGQTILLAPLQPVEESGAVQGFYTKVAYLSAQTGDIQWQAKLVWMIQMQNDSWFRSGGYQTNRMVTETRLLHQYQEPFRITGLQVTRNEGAEVALFGTPANLDDRYLFQLFMGLGDTFLAHEKLEGQGASETALAELYARFTNGDTLVHTFGIPDNTVAMSQPASYRNGDEAIAGVGSEMLPAFFDAYPIYSQERYQDAEGNPVSSGTLLLASEQSHGVFDLRHFSHSDNDPHLIDLAQLHVNMADVAVLTTRNVNLRMYEPDLSNEWQIVTPSRMLELVNARYAGVYDTTLAALHPYLQAQHAQFIAVTGYLWAYAGSLATVSLDGQLLLPELTDEEALALRRATENALEGNSINYLAMATGIVDGLGQLYSLGQGIYEAAGLRTDWAKLTMSGKLGSSALAGFQLAAGTASLVMGALNTVCKTNPELGMCQNQTAWLIANVAVKELALAVQMVATSVMIVKYALHVLEDVTKSSKIAGAIGLGVGIAVAWVNFGFTVWLSWGNPIAWRVALGMAIVTTIWLIFLFALNFIPVIGQIISAVLSFIDALISLFTGLFAGQDWNFAKIILNLFYDAKVTSSIKEATFGAFQSGLVDLDQGMIDGNVFRLELPASGVIQKENGGKDKDLELSYVEGDLEPNAVDGGFSGEDMSSPRECQIVGEERHCSNTAAVGYLLRPAVNGAASFVARVLYQTAWAEYAFYGGVRYSTHTTAGMLPEDGGEPITLYLDVLPPTVSGLWNWAALGNADKDGDGLTAAQEAALRTNSTLWDSDGDGLSDFFEWQSAAELGANPRLADSDGDGLSDGLELRLGTRINVADSDGDGLRDGEEVRRYDPVTRAMVGGWQVTLPGSQSFWVSSEPLSVDDDGDGLNGFEEKAMGLSPHALNALVPGLSLRAAPVIDIPDARQGLYWLPGTVVSFTVELANIATAPVTTSLTLALPDWLDGISGGVLQGDRSITPSQNGNTLTWDFAGANALQLYETVSATVNARVNPATMSASSEIAVDLLYGQVQLHKPIQATVDGDAPFVAIVAPVAGDFLRGTSYVAGGTATDATTWITERSLSIVPQGSPANFQSLPAGQGPWAYSWNFPAADGRYTLQARAVDAMGHVATSDVVNVAVDNTPPIVTLTSAMVGNAVQLSGTATDNLAGVEWVQLAIDGQPWRSVPLVGTAWSYNWTVGQGAQGDHDVRVRAIDRSHNESATASRTITVDSVAPSSSVNRGADPDLPPAIAANSVYTITGIADEGGHLPPPAVGAHLRAGMDVFDDPTLWLGLSSIHDNDGGVFAAWIGDFNADRMADLAVGLPGPAGAAGEVVVVYGRAGGWPALPELEMLAASRTRFSGAPGSRLGSYLAAAGDVNGDNYADLLIGERDSTRAFLVFGNPGPLGAVTLESGQPGYRTLLEAPAAIEGLSAAGDVDGDGLGDLLVQAGGTAYLLLGRANPWPTTVDVAEENVASFTAVVGAIGVGDVDGDQRAEWVTTASRRITLYGWNASSGLVEEAATLATADTSPQAVALGDVDGDGRADWLYTNDTSRVLVYGSGATPHTFAGYSGSFAAPGDVDGDGRSDILLVRGTGVASLVSQRQGGTPAVIATIDGVGGAASAPYAAGADLNSDGSAELLLIPSQAAAEARGFDAPDFSSGFVSPQELPLGISSVVGEKSVTELTTAAAWPLSEYTMSLALMDVEPQSTGADTRYVDDDAVGGTCEGNSPCFTTIQAAVAASDGGGDTIVVYPGVYGSFQVPAGSNYDYLNIQGVSADAVFVEGGTGDAIHIAADGVRVSNLTVRRAIGGVVLENGAGEAPAGSGNETVIDQLLIHSVQNPIVSSQSAVLSVSDSTLVGNGTDPILSVDATLNSAVHTWNLDRTLAQSPSANAGLASTGGALYAVPGGMNSAVYSATPGANGALGQWSNTFNLAHALPAENGKSLLTAGGNYLYQIHPDMATADFGTSDGEIRTVAIAPNGDVYVGGRFTTIGGISAVNIARWDGSAWRPLGTNLSNGVAHTDGSGIVYAITVLANNEVYVGGAFNRAYDGSMKYAHNIVRWNATTAQWSPLGSNVENANGTDGPVYALAHSDDGYVFVGGSFGSCPGAPGWVVAKNFAMWKNNAWWNAIANGVDAPIRTLTWSGGVLEGRSSDYPEYGEAGKLYAGGDFIRVDNEYQQYTVDDNFPVVANHVAYWHVEAWNPVGPYHRSAWVALGSGISSPVVDLALDQTTETDRLYAAAASSTDDPLHFWDGGSWGTVGPSLTNGYTAVALDTVGNLYAAGLSGGQSNIYTGAAGNTGWMSLIGTETTKVWDLVPNGVGQVVAARGAQATLTGAIRHWALASLYRRDLSGTAWERFPYPPSFNTTVLPKAVAVDNAGNLYASAATGSLYRFNAASKAWEGRANLALTDLVWAGDRLHALVYSSTNEQWHLYRYDPAGWTQIGSTPLPAGATTALSRSLSSDGGDSIYVLQASGFYRYRMSANAWDLLPQPSISFSIAKYPGLVVAGNYLYTYAAPSTGVTPNVFRYGAVGTSDLRLTVKRTALVMPDAASSFAWVNLSSREGTYRFLTDVDNTNIWVGPSSASWSPALATDAARLTSAQADFAAPEDGLYRLGPNSQLTAGYHQYKAVAHVYPSQAACTDCGDTLAWGETAFATVREAVESGAARVLIHPGRYPQSFYLVSGVEVIGSGAETTIIEPAATINGTLVTAEGVASASLARVTLSGSAGWTGFLAEGGATGLTLSRSIIRDLDTGVQLRGGSAVEFVNNTIVRNVTGFAADGDNPVNVRNTIFAYNSSAGLQRGAGTSSLSVTYNAFWANGADMVPAETVSLGSLFVDPRFRNLATYDFRLSPDSPLIDKGAPGDPTVPGGGARVDIGYAECNAAGFYVSQDYSETGLNDGLTWGVDAFDHIQLALDAAAATMYGLQGALPQGGYSVGVDGGIYTETVSVPSHVRLVGSGPEVTTIDAGNEGTAVTFNGVIDAEISGFTVKNASSNSAGITVHNAASGITITRNVISDNAGHGIRLASNSSAVVLFNTVAGNGRAGVYVAGSGAWASVRNNIFDSNATGLQVTAGGLLRNDYNLLHNTTDLASVVAGANTITAAPAFATSGYYIPTAASPAIDAAEPQAQVPVAGGLRADLGYKELIASPLVVLFGPEINSTVTGNSGVAKVEVATILVTDVTQPVTATLPAAADWQALIPAQTGQPLYYWSQSRSEATPGLYRVYSRATDAAGNTEMETLDWYEGAFIVDSVAPTLSWSATLPGSTSAAAVLAAVDVVGTVGSGNAARDDVVQLYFTVDAAGSRTIYPAIDGQAWIPLPATGSYTINAIAIDEAGNQAQESTTVVVSAANHVATVIAPLANSSGNSTSLTLRGYVRFSGTGTGAVAVDVTGGAAVAATLAEPGAAFSAWSAEITLPDGEGAKTVTVTPRLDGVDGTATTVNLALDTTGPTLTIASPAAGATVTRTIRFAGSVSDTGSGLARVEVSLDGGYIWQRASMSSDTWRLDWQSDLDQDYVSYPARVRAVDAAGNITLVEHVVVVDNVPPSDLAPVTFSEPVGQHLASGASLSIDWNAPLEAGGTARVMLAVDQNTETVPSAEASGTSSSATLDAPGGWYVHLMAEDATGNEALYHYGPWHVRDMTNATFSARRQSIILDGFLDMAHDEWLETDLLGTDARSGHPQALYFSWDGQHLFVGWSGAWWTLDGVLWAYIDVAAGGASAGVDGRELPATLLADRAIEIDGPDAGTLWSWNGAAWVEGTLDFASGPSGDTEARVATAPSSGHDLRLVAFALPHAVEGEPETEFLALAGFDAAEQPLSIARGRGLSSQTLAAEGSVTTVQALSEVTPWAVFPTTNSLAGDAIDGFVWAGADLPSITAVNAGQPAARTVVMAASSSQPSGAALCPASNIIYDIRLENPEPDDFTGLTLTLSASEGLSYQSVTGASLGSGAPGDSSWILNVPTLAAGASTNIVVTGRTATNLSSLSEVTTSITLAAGATPLTAESNLEAALAHSVDGQPPAITINTLAGLAIAGGEHTFTGAATDNLGSGIARVEVSLDGAAWGSAAGTLAWSAALTTSGSEVTLQARAVDQCGYASSVASETFTIDSTPPQVAWTAPAVVTTSPARLTGSTVDPAPEGSLVQRIEVQVDSAASAWLTALGPLAPQNGAQIWTWSWLAPQEDGVAHQLRVRATDAVGNTTVTPWQDTLVDTIAPQITLTQQLTSTQLAAGMAPAPVLGGSATDGSGIQAVRVLVYDPLGQAAIAQASLSGGDWEYWPDLSGWVSGNYALRVQAVDVHGNVRTQGPYLLAVEDAPIAGLSASNDGPHLLGQEVTLSAAISAGTNVTYAWAFGDGETAAGAVVTHVYSASGEYNAIVTASNSVSTMEAVTPVTILAMTVNVGEDQTVDEGALVAIFATFTDGRPDVGHTAAIDWGDGEVTAGVVDETNLTISGEHAYADDGAYTVTLTVDDGKGQTAAGSLQVTVNNVAPVATLVNDGPQAEASPVTVSFTGVYDPGADTITYSFDWDGDGVFDLVNQDAASALYTWPDNSDYTVRGRVEDDDGGYSEYTTDIHVHNVAPAVSGIPQNQTVTYSEAIAAVTFVATDVEADAMSAAFSWSSDGTTFQSGSSAAVSGLSLGDASCTVSAGLRTCVWEVTGNVLLPTGAYTLRLTVADKDSDATTSDVLLAVQPEEADVEFDPANSIAVPVATAGGASGTFTLRVCVSEEDTASPGDISLAQVTMSLAPVGPGGPVSGLVAATYFEQQRKCVTFAFSDVPVNTYVVEVIVSGSYEGRNEDVLVVYDPSLGFTTGGGWFYWPGTAKPETGYPGDKTNFGFTMKYLKNGKNVQGNLLLIRHLEDGTIYRVKSNALYGLALGEDSTVPMGWASFSGKATYQEPGWPEPIGNYEFTVYVEDRNEPGSGVDRLWIEVSGGLSLPRNAIDNALNIEGGNLVVPHKAR